MPNEAVEQTTGISVWQAKQVYAMAAVCLLLGLAIGYLFRGSQSPARPVPQAGGNQPAATAGRMGGQMPSLEDMKGMADKKAAPLLEKLEERSQQQRPTHPARKHLQGYAPVQGRSRILRQGGARRPKERCHSY